MCDLCGIVWTFSVGLHAMEETWEAYAFLRRRWHHDVRQKIRKIIRETICNTAFSSSKIKPFDCVWNLHNIEGNNECEGGACQLSQQANLISHPTASYDGIRKAMERSGPVAYRGGEVWGVQTPRLPEIPNFWQSRIGLQIERKIQFLLPTHALIT